MTRPVPIPELPSLSPHPAEQTGESASREPESTQAHAIPEILQARLAMLAELEASLQASQRALLSRDIASLEKHTSEQNRLQPALAILSGPMPRLSGSSSSPTLAAELRAAELRVLQLGRVQAALLARARRWLRTIAHLLAGVEKNYAPPSGTSGTTHPVPPAVPADPNSSYPAARASEDNSCRV